MIICVMCCVVLQDGEATPVSTGYLEVEIVGGQLLHSKKVTDLMYYQLSTHVCW